MFMILLELQEKKPLKSSGVRIGTPAMTTKGWKEEDFEKLASIMMEFLKLCKEEKQEEKIEEYTEKVVGLIESVK